MSTSARWDCTNVTPMLSASIREGHTTVCVNHADTLAMDSPAKVTHTASIIVLLN